MSDKADKRKVFVKANFLKVSDINTIKEEFSADIYVTVRWREPTLDNSKDLSVSDFSKYWDPKIHISNSAPNASLKSWKSLRLAKNGDAYIIQKFRVKGLFAENLELHEFPFDIQDLSVAVASELSDDKVEVVEDDEEISAVNVSCFVDETEWTICDLVYSEPRVTRQEFTDTQFKNPALNVKCVAIRRAGFFLYNIILIVTMITTLSFATFAVDTNLTQNRLQLSFIILLTGVTFKMVSVQSLPKIPYLTHLDRYIIGSMTFNWMVCLWHAIVSRFDHQPDYQQSLDFWAFIVLIILYVLFQIVFYLLVLIKRIMRRISVREKEEAYQDKATRLMGSTWKSDRKQRLTAWNRRNRIDANGQFQIKP